jgi:hypothetical protein
MHRYIDDLQGRCRSHKLKNVMGRCVDSLMDILTEENNPQPLVQLRLLVRLRLQHDNMLISHKLHAIAVNPQSHLTDVASSVYVIG